MFGYVTLYKNELKIKDYEKFRAYYCGLCKELGKRFNQLVRLGLSYDFTFLAIIMDSLDKNETHFEYTGCLKHLGKKRETVMDNSSVGYAADMSVVLMYYKLLDDILDDHSLLSALSIIPYWFAVRKIRKRYPDIVLKIQQHLKSLSILEKENCASVDEVAHNFAEIMALLFDCGDENLKRLGYNIGRFIYIVDAVTDFEDDVKKDKYNPLRYAYPDKTVEEIKRISEQSMLITLSMAGEYYQNLDIQKNKEILDNIIYMGLRQQMEKAVCEKCDMKGKRNGKSL